MKTVIAASMCALVLGVTLSAQAQMAPEDQIKTRKAGYSFMAWNMGKIKAQVIDQSVEFNQAQILASANAIAAISNSGMGALFGPGTESNVGDEVTRVKPELFDNIPDVVELSANLSRATADLQAQAETGDQTRIRTAFGAVGQACKACHDKYRQD